MASKTVSPVDSLNRALNNLGHKLTREQYSYFQVDGFIELQLTDTETKRLHSRFNKHFIITNTKITFRQD